MSNLTFKTTLGDYRDALTFLGNRADRILCYRTHVANYGDGSKVRVLHHGSIIGTFYRDATLYGPLTMSHAVPVLRLRTAGWSSKTTTDRMNRLLRSTLEGLGPGVRYWTHSIRIKGGAAVLTTDSGLGGATSEPIGGRSVAVYADGEVRVEVDIDG